MNSAAEATTTLGPSILGPSILGRSIDPLEHVDYRRADTAEEKDEIYRLRYRAYLREGAILASESERVTDRYDDLPNNFTFGIYIRAGLIKPVGLMAAKYSEIRESVFQRFPFMRSSAFERRMLFERPAEQSSLSRGDVVFRRERRQQG